LSVNKEHNPTAAACTDVMRSLVKNQRYKLKKQYFNGVPANEITRTSPVDFMTDVEWRELVAFWSDPKNMVHSFFIFPNFSKSLQMISY
jgi:hypothetical protein